MSGAALASGGLGRFASLLPTGGLGRDNPLADIPIGGESRLASSRSTAAMAKSEASARLLTSQTSAVKAKSATAASLLTSQNTSTKL